MKVEIWRDERYPDYGMSVWTERSRPSRFRHVVDIPDADYAEYVRVSELYDAMQNKLAAAYDSPPTSV